MSRRLDLWSRTPLSEIMVTLKGSNESLRSEMRAHKSQDDLTKLKLRIKSCLQEGAISKAAKELLSDGLHPWTPSVSQKLHELHPQKPLPPFRDSFADEVHGDCSPEELLGILKSFPLGSAPGPSGLRPVHLLECVSMTREANNDKLCLALTDLVNIASEGKLPKVVSPLLLAARLLPFKKRTDPTGVRPIAVGETIRRIIAKAVLGKSITAAEALLSPIQNGVRISNAVPFTIQSAQRCYAMILR